ncbi:unnamed protein product, partial [Haemonchus placei]|uniref:DUF4758 domain-containing protein n=1 Tax=Haemonchus placei TaxID=6290 RepID=A0A0N4WUZ9_HAEPC
MADNRGRPPKLPPRPDSQSDRPTWTVTRRERTELSPLRSTSPFQSRTVTTTERVQILQMPINLTEQQIEPARLLALSPHGNPTQSVSSTVTTLAAEGIPLISGVTSDGASLFQGILYCPESRHTTTIITTTTTTYRMVEVSDSDSLSDDFELVDSSTLTVDVPLVTSRTSSPSQYMIVAKKETEAPLSPVLRSTMNIDLELFPKRIERAKELDEKPLVEEVSVYHSGVSSDHDGTQSTSELEKVESPEIYTQEDITSASDKDYGINIRSSSDLKTISTSSDDEDLVLIEREMVQMTTSESSIGDEKYGDLKEKGTEESIQMTSERAEETQGMTTADVAKMFSEKITRMLQKQPATMDYSPSQMLTRRVTLTETQEDIETKTVTEEIFLRESQLPSTDEDQSMLKGVESIEKKYYGYPSTSSYEGPLDSFMRTSDIYGEPLKQYVTVYHSGRSDEPVPKPEEEHVDIADAAKAFGE